MGHARANRERERKVETSLLWTSNYNIRSMRQVNAYRKIQNQFPVRVIPYSLFHLDANPVHPVSLWSNSVYLPVLLF